MFISTQNIDGNTLVLAVLAVATSANFLWKIHSDRAAARKSKHLQDTADKIHTLTNSNFGGQLRVNVVAFKALVVAMQRLAASSGSEADGAALADARAKLVEAERSLLEHLLRQARVDAAEAVAKL